MAHLRVEIIDPACEGDEAYVYKLPADTDHKDVMTAVAVFYPEATFISLEAEEGE